MARAAGGSLAGQHWTSTRRDLQPQQRPAAPVVSPVLTVLLLSGTAWTAGQTSPWISPAIVGSMPMVIMRICRDECLPQGAAFRRP